MILSIHCDLFLSISFFLLQFSSNGFYILFSDLLKIEIFILYFVLCFVDSYDFYDN